MQNLEHNYTPDVAAVRKSLELLKLPEHVPIKSSIPDSIVPTMNISSGRKQCPYELPTTFPLGCQDNVCHGSIMEKHGSIVGGIDRPALQIWEEAYEYIREYYKENQLPNTQQDVRLAEVHRMIFEKGYYTHTSDELSFGVKTVWRNSRRCIMRSQWNTIQTIDRRDVTTGKEMLEACFYHLHTSHNGGRIRPTMTIFPQKFPGRTGPRIWGIQLTRYAGYRMPDGSIIGDPMNIELTDIAIRLGWKPKYGRWDVLPVIVSADGEAPVWGELPSNCYTEVKITHPDLPWFEELDLRWFDHPAVSAFVITIGGIDYCAAPFSGWFQGTEIGSRNLGDEHRYNMLPEIARRLGLPLRNRSLWKDRAILELNQAVLYSFDKAKITIVDHHSASDSFVSHYEKEIKTRGHCPADWVWITPPCSSSTTSVFHQEMYSYLCKPAVIPLPEKPWETYFRETGIDCRPSVSNDSAQFSLVSLAAEGANRIIIAYGTETGNAECYAKEVQKHLRMRLSTADIGLAGLDGIDLSRTRGVLCVVTSSFGGGDPPSNAVAFRDRLVDAVKLHNFDPNLHHFKFNFAVLGLGSTTYAESYQRFPQMLDRNLACLGARRIIPRGAIDECDLSRAEGIFAEWVHNLAVAIEVGADNADVEVEDEEKLSSLGFLRALENLSRYRTVKLTGSKPVFTGANHDTYHVELTSADGSDFSYAEGDYISILPNSKPEQLEAIKQFVGTWGHHAVDNFCIRDILTEYVDLEATINNSVEQQQSGVAVLQVLQSKLSPAANFLTRDELSGFIRSLPLKTARVFSISSSPEVHSPTEIHIAIARIRRGRVSGPLTTQQVTMRTTDSDSEPLTFRASIRSSMFKMLQDLSVPIILVGSGTGVGPLRGMMRGRVAAQERAVWTPNGSDSEVLPAKGDIICFTGARSPEEHCYLSEFIEESALGRISHYPAYSRFGEHKSRGYVGDLLYRQSAEVARVLRKGAVILVCGSHAMRDNVEEALLKVAAKEMRLRGESAEEYVMSLKKGKRFLSSTYTRTK